jgi:hypothetical protein
VDVDEKQGLLKAAAGVRTIFFHHKEIDDCSFLFMVMR